MILRRIIRFTDRLFHFTLSKIPVKSLYLLFFCCHLSLCWNLVWFVVITTITVTANTFFRAVKSDVPASPSAYSLPWAGGSRVSMGCVFAPHRCSLLCLPETHNTESTLTFNSTNIHSSNKLKQTQHLAAVGKQALKNVLLTFSPSNQKRDT